MSPLTIQLHSSVFPLTNPAKPQTTIFTLPSRPRILIPQATFSSSSNSPLWTISEIVRAVNGRIIKWGPPGTICTDTRTLEPGQWFLPLVGQNFDAHNFITSKLATKGCVGVIGNWVCEGWNNGFVQVEGDTMSSLKRLGFYARNMFTGCLIGLTGSVGKTTTKTMVALALESVGAIYYSPGNWNNEIGVALSLIGMSRDVGFGVLEMGMSKKGEILELSRMCRPDVRVILNVNAAHLENFANLEEVSVAKGEILREAMPGHVCVLNGDDPLVMSLPVPVGVKKVVFGRKLGCDVRLVSSQIIDGGRRIQIVLEGFNETVKFIISSPGLHLAVNACAAAAVASALGIPLALAGNSLSRFIPVHRRSELEVTENGITIINDVYNASPASTQAAIDLLRNIDCKGKRVAILGDMLELGPTEFKFHELMLQSCCDAHFDIVALVGTRFVSAAGSIDFGPEIKLLCTTNAHQMTSKIINDLNSGDVVLVKGSRQIGMEVIVDAIKSIHFAVPLCHAVMSKCD
ncbi:UDP-N-acetylmuramoyl-tripeptide--D-alanyl-D-alanine ligase-like [Solanum tuberosum]|uniref:UDP-MurNAc-pentapeptide synthetase n=2 Tax=Solanum tuberosum TaxID=4113 RepID=M1CDE5_SOLTU|nr:PREDICTED: UDP-N-acetylmuramoyl-tripeptide--D-alanyl-D-alanine ligase-like [Solanum tuberosum]